MLKRIVTDGGLIKERFYLGGWEIYRERDGSGKKFERETLHVMDDARRVAMVETKTWEGYSNITDVEERRRWQYDNHLGSACVECDGSGAVISYEEYHAYGTPAYRAVKSGCEVPEKRYRYTGKERDDETGFQENHWRYYVPWLGRWTGADPVRGVASGFEYSSGRATTAVDPHGLFDSSEVVARIGRLALQVKRSSREVEAAARGHAAAQLGLGLFAVIPEALRFSASTLGGGSGGGDPFGLRPITRPAADRNPEGAPVILRQVREAGGLGQPGRPPPAPDPNRVTWQYGENRWTESRAAAPVPGSRAVAPAAPAGNASNAASQAGNAQANAIEVKPKQGEVQPAAERIVVDTNILKDFFERGLAKQVDALLGGRRPLVPDIVVEEFVKKNSAPGKAERQKQLTEWVLARKGEFVSSDKKLAAGDRAQVLQLKRPAKDGGGNKKDLAELTEADSLVLSAAQKQGVQVMTGDRPFKETMEKAFRMKPLFFDKRPIK